MAVVRLLVNCQDVRRDGYLPGLVHVLDYIVVEERLRQQRDYLTGVVVNVNDGLGLRLLRQRGWDLAVGELPGAGVVLLQGLRDLLDYGCGLALASAKVVLDLLDRVIPVRSVDLEEDLKARMVVAAGYQVGGGRKVGAGLVGLELLHHVA